MVTTQQPQVVAREPQHWCISNSMKPPDAFLSGTLETYTNMPLSMSRQTSMKKNVNKRNKKERDNRLRAVSALEIEQ